MEDQLSAPMVRMNFILFHIYKGYVQLPDFPDPIILSQEILRVQRCIEVPACDYPNSASNLTCETLTAMGLPRYIHEHVLSQVCPDVMFLLEISGYTTSASVNTYMTQVHWREYDHRNPYVINLLMGVGIRLPIPASKSSIDGLTRLMFRIGIIGIQDSKNCTVCMEDFEDGDDLIQMPCSHLYHEDCIVKWLMSSHLCPLCRHQMPTIQLHEPCQTSTS
ncbi:hypothetical protein P3X46_029703 [Hevea brasiliensis]|uniref:RING-type E3 ubiquitin transferase n=2 Tax=Hevea brasiliensis TaxID=3981 RepID=A0ABQ9KT16_HEVBR|nr:hypothetical protein P3X46_029703 [Hevea brasiliensis]